MPRHKVWRPRQLWTRRPVTQVVPDRREPGRQEIKRRAREAAEDDGGDGREIVRYGPFTMLFADGTRMKERYPEGLL